MFVSLKIFKPALNPLKPGQYYSKTLLNSYPPIYWNVIEYWPVFLQGPTPPSVAPPAGRVSSDCTDLWGQRFASRPGCCSLPVPHLAHTRWVHHHPGSSAGQRDRTLTENHSSSVLCNLLKKRLMERGKKNSRHLQLLICMIYEKNIGLDEVTGSQMETWSVNISALFADVQ